MSETIDPLQLFAYYHLGLDDELVYRFRNLHHAAAHFERTPEEIVELLEIHRMDPTLVKHLDFNLAKAHGDAMELDLVGASKAVRTGFLKTTWSAYQAALARGPSAVADDDVDWDDPLS